MLEPVDDKDVKGRTGHAGKGDYYGKYRIAVEKSGIDTQIHEHLKNNPEAKFKSADIAREMGQDFVRKSPTSLQWALKYVLFYKGIVVTTASHVNGSELLKFRKIEKTDRLPDSLIKKAQAGEQKEEQAGEQKEEQASEQEEEVSEQTNEQTKE